MMRISEPGWMLVLMEDPSGRRGLWVRISDTTVELCAGREGDDAYVALAPTVGQNAYDLREVVAYGFQYSARAPPAPVSAPQEWADAYQDRIAAWVKNAFGEEALTDRWERTARVVEEAIELAQAEGLDHEDVYRVWQRVYSRGKGSVSQEAAGLMVCFLAWAAGTDTDLRAVTLTEIERIERPEVTERIRAKQLEKAAAGTGKGYRAPLIPEKQSPPAPQVLGKEGE